MQEVGESAVSRCFDYRVVGPASLAASLFAHAVPPVLHVAIGINKPPYIVEATRSGLEYELVNAIVTEMGYRMEPDFVPPARMAMLVRAGQFDMAITVREVSGLPGFYSAPYIRYQNAAFALARTNVRLDSIEDLSRYSVAAFQNARIALGERFRAATDQNPNYQEVSPQSTQNKLLYAGRVDVVVADRRIFHYFNGEVGSTVDTRQPIREYSLFPPTDYQALFRQANQRDQFNAALQRIHDNGVYDAILRRYPMPTTEPPR